MEKQIPLSRTRRELTSLLRWLKKYQGQVVITHKHKVVGSLLPPAVHGCYVRRVQAYGEDAVLVVPRSLLAELGWGFGAELAVNRTETGDIVLREVGKRTPIF